MDNISPADLAAVVGNNDFNNSGSWWIILLFICLFGNGGLWGNNAATAATTADIQRAVDLNSIQEGQANIQADIQRTTYETIGSIKDAAYNNLSEIRDIQSANAAGFSNMQTNFCGTQRMIDGVKYENAINTAAINANIDAKFAAIERGQLEQRIAAQAEQIQQLQLNAAFCGVPRISTYAYNVVPNFPNIPGPVFNGTTF